MLPCCVHCKPANLNTSTCMAYVVRTEAEVIHCVPLTYGSFLFCIFPISSQLCCFFLCHFLVLFLQFPLASFSIFSHLPRLYSTFVVPLAHFPHPPTPGGEYRDGVPVLNCSGTFLQDDERYQHSHQHSR